MAKIINYGQPIGAGTTVIPDNQVALDIESTDAKEYIEINTSDSAPTIVLGKDGAVVGVNDSAPQAQLSIKSASTDTSSHGSIQVRASNGEKGILLSTINTDEGKLEMFKGGTSQTVINARTGVVHNDQGVATYDFRVESDSNTHMLFVDGGANAVGINQSSVDAPLHVVGVGGDTGKAWSTGNASPTVIIENGTGSSKDRCLLALNGDGSSGSSIDLHYADTRVAGFGGWNGNASIYGDGVPLTVEATGANLVKVKTNNKERMTFAATGTIQVTGGFDTQLTGHLDSSSSGTSLVGDGTDFLTELKWGSPIQLTAGGTTQTFTIVGIGSDTTATLDSPISGTPSDGSSMFTDPPAFHFKTGDNQDLFKVVNPMSFHLGANLNTGLKVGNTVFPNDENGQSENTGFGTNVGSALTGNSNVLVGQSVFSSATGASGGNVCVGRMIGSAASGVKSDNTIVGGASGTALTTSSHNSFFGREAGNAVTSGSQNISIGSGSDCAATVNNQIAIGYGSVTDGVNKMRLGNATLATADIKVDWTVDSDERIKENVQDADAGLDFVNALRPVSFTRKHPAEWPSEIREKIYTQGALDVDEEGNETWRSTPQFDVDNQQPIKDEFDDTSRVDGLLAQEVRAAVQSLGVSFNGVNEAANGKLGIQYATLVVPLIKSVQELSSHIATLTARIEVLENGE